MDKYETLVDKLYPDVLVLETPSLFDIYAWWGTFGIEDGQPYIFVEPKQSAVDKYEVVKEEFDHVITAAGILLNRPGMNYSQKLSVRKQELIARHLSYKELVTIDDLIKCWKLGLVDEWEIAEHLDLSPEFLHNAIKYLKSVYPSDFVAETDFGNYQVIVGSTFTFHQLVDNPI